MTNAVEDDPAVVVFDFLSLLPDTIRSDIILFVLIWAFDWRRIGIANPVEVLRERLNPSSQITRFSSALRCIGVIDFVLFRFVAANFEAIDALETAQNDERSDAIVRAEIEKILLGSSLQKKHFEIALGSWNALRAHKISPLRLIGFEHRSLRG